VTDFLEVKAKRTFAHGKDLKTKKSPSFEMEAGEARQLEASGLVEIVGKTGAGKAPEPVEPASASDPADEPRKAKKGKSDADTTR
jgi:hypothetical protein